MNAPDLSHTLDQSPEPSPAPQPLGKLLAIDDCALAYARKFNAIAEDGTLVCIKCGSAPGLLPHLCCNTCISKHRRGWR